MERQEIEITEIQSVPALFRCHERVSDAYRFAHPSSDPTWAAAMSILLIFSILIIVGTALDVILSFFENKRNSGKPEVFVEDLPVDDSGTINKAYLDVAHRGSSSSIKDLEKRI